MKVLETLAAKVENAGTYQKAMWALAVGRYPHTLAWANDQEAVIQKLIEDKVKRECGASFPSVREQADKLIQNPELLG